MKKLIVSALAAVVLAGSAIAQDVQPHREGFGRHHHYGNMKELNLTDEQKSAMKTINEDYRKQLTELKKNEDITVREWKSRMGTIQKEHRSKVQGVLTAEQKVTMEKMRQDRKDKMKKGGQHRMDSLKKDLNLTAGQETALKQQRTQMMEKLKAIKEDKSLTDDQKKVEMKKFREQQHESLKSILSEEQLNKLQQKKSHGQKPVL